MTEPEPEDDEQDAYHYVYCDYCGRKHSEWSVIVDEDGNVAQLECKTCGGTDWERGMEASHV